MYFTNEILHQSLLSPLKTGSRCLICLRIFPVGILNWSPMARKYCFVISKFPRYDYENSRSKPDIEKVEFYQQHFNLVYKVHRSLGDILAMHIYMKSNSLFKPSFFSKLPQQMLFQHQLWPLASWLKSVRNFKVLYLKAFWKNKIGIILIIVCIYLCPPCLKQNKMWNQKSYWKQMRNNL